VKLQWIFFTRKAVPNGVMNLGVDTGCGPPTEWNSESLAVE